MKVRLADIAALAQVSEATVSRVLNQKPGISLANRKAVFDACEELGYVAPQRVRKSAGLIGLIVPELTNPVFPQFAQTIESECASAGYTTVLCTQSSTGLKEDEYVQTLMQHKVAGIIFVSGFHANLETDVQRYHQLRASGLPITLVNGYRDGVDATFFSADEATGIQLAVDHLVELGHRRIGLAIGSARYVPSVRKINAFADALRRLDSGLSDDAAATSIAKAVYSREGGRLAAAQLVESEHTGIIFGSDVMALGGLEELARRGLSVPQDISVVAADNTDVTAFTHPALTTIDQPIEDIASAAAQSLIAEIAGHAGPRAEVLFRPGLVARASTAAPGPGARRAVRVASA